MLGINKSMRKITYYENILEFKENTKEVLNLNEINNWKLCRTCLVDTDENDVNINNMSIMDAMRGTILNIKEMLVEITKIKISKTENLPLQVCNECFSKITELYYFNIQIRKAERVLNRLAEKCKDHRDMQGTSEESIEVEDYRDMGSISDIARNSIDIIQDEISKQETKDSPEFLEEIFDTAATLENNENSEFGALFRDQNRKTPLLTEMENHAELKSNSSDEESNIENNLIEYLESCDTDNGDSLSNSTIEINEIIKYKLKETKVKPNKTRVASATTGYKHKQPRVTSPLLDDFDCAICHISFGRQQDLVQHVRDSHPNSKAYKCRVCANLFSHIQSLSRHMNTHKESVILNECEYCSKSFVRVDDLKRHLRVHTGERPYVCSICEKSFQQQSDLKCHQKRHTYDDNNLQPKIFECSQCKKSYTSRTGLNWHKRKYHRQETHSQQSLHHCLVCGKAFNKEFRVKQHSVIQLPSVKNKCRDCEKSFPFINNEENEENFTIIDE